MYRKILNLKILNLFWTMFVVFICLAIVVFSTTSLISTRNKLNETFSINTQIITRHMQLVMNYYNNYLLSSRSFLLNSQTVTDGEWAGFHRSQNVFSDLKGLVSIGYVRLVSNENLQAFINDKKSRSGNSLNTLFNPSQAKSEYALLDLSLSRAPTELNLKDYLSDTLTSDTFTQSSGTGTWQASAIYENSNSKNEFVTVLPVTINNNLEGFVMANILADEFFIGLNDPQHIHTAEIKITDVTNKEKPVELYKTTHWDHEANSLSRTDVIDFGGRIWEIGYKNSADSNIKMFINIYPYIVATAGILLIYLIINGIKLVSRRINRSAQGDTDL